MLPTRTPVVRLGGLQRFEHRNIRDAMLASDFDPSAAGSQWVLHASDIHFMWISGGAQYTTVNYRVKAELLKLAAYPPQYCVINGDILTEYAPAFGYGPWPAGPHEAGYSNPEMPVFSALAPLRVTTGNHDTAPNDSPYDSFLTANCPWYVGNGGIKTWTSGGVLNISVPQNHGTGIPSELKAALTAAIAARTSTQEVALYYHAPSLGTRCGEHKFVQDLLSCLPGGITNLFWGFCGHVHEISAGCFNLNGTTTFYQQSFSCTSSDVFSADSTKPAMAAICMKNGKVHCVLNWYGVSGLWTVMSPISRAGAAVLPLRSDGVPTPILSQYWESEYTRTGIHLSTPNTAGTFRDAMSYLVEVNNIAMVFPLPATATKFWACMNALPATVQVSGDGVSFQSVTPSALDRNITTMTIPVGLRGGASLYVTMTAAARQISGWGFSL